MISNRGRKARPTAWAICLVAVLIALAHLRGMPAAADTPKPRLDQLHQQNGVTCADCHGEVEPAVAAGTEQCLACHESLQQITHRTAQVKPSNPHASPHGKTYTACDLCHRQHQPSENFCAQCHAFDFAVP